MHDTRGAQFGAVVGDQQKAKSGDEAKRAAIASKVEGIYTTTKGQVEGRLARIDSEADAIFDKGAEQAKADFENFVDRGVFLFKAERYLGSPIGLLKLARDLLLGLPPEVNNIYTAGRNRYIQQMRGVISQVAQVVAVGLNEAKGLIAGGLREVAAFVASLPEAERALGEQAASGIQDKFTQLRAQVDERKNKLIDRLAQKYVDNLKAIDADISKRQEENKGLVDKARDAINSVLETIRQLKEMFLGVLAKAAAVIELIIKDPIGFLSNLVSGIGQGLKSFVANIGNHLKKGFMEWLFGQISAAGIKLPETFDLKGIFSLVLQVLGLTYENIRARAVRILGEETVARLEQVAEIFKIMITEGPAGIWQFVKDKLGDLKGMIIDTIMNFVIEKVIVGGIEFLLSLLTPASAFVKAVKMIIQIVQFIIQRGSQILSFVNAIVDSLAAIASGNVGAVAAAVENALARFIPVAIGFLMSLLGLGGISEKIKSVIEAIQAPVNKAIDFVINLAVKVVKAAGNFLAGGASKKPKPGEEPAPDADPQKQARIEAGLAAIDQEEQRFLEAGKIEHKEAEQVAATVLAKHPVFKSLVAVDGGLTWDYEYEASPKKRKKGEIKEDGTVHLNFKALGKRPKNFRDETDKDLARRFPNFFDPPGSTNLKEGNDRRHVIAFSTLVDDLEHQINGKSVEQVRQALKDRGNEPKADTIGAIEEAVRAEVLDLFNDPKNLFIEESEENQRLGREIGKKRRERDDINPVTNPKEFETKSRELAAVEVDVGPTQGKGNETREDGDAIATVRNVDKRMAQHQNVAGQGAAVARGGRPSPAFRSAQTDQENLREATGHLGDNVRDRRKEVRDRMQTALTRGIQILRRLGEFLSAK